MKEKTLFLAVMATTVIMVAGCGTSNDQLNESSTEVTEKVEISLSEVTLDNSTSSAVVDSTLDVIKAEDSISDASNEASSELSENASLGDSDSTSGSSEDVAVSSEENSEGKTAAGYSAEDIERIYKNYISAELTYIDLSAIDIDVWFSEDKYWVDTFQDNETDSMHPVKSGSAYIDPITGKGKFWIWGWYDDPDAEDVDFSKYDY